MNSQWRNACLSAILTVVMASPAYSQSQFPAAGAESVNLETDDGVQLAVTYYASPEGKKATPVVLLHDHKDTRSVFATLAERLRSPGENDKHVPFAVVTVDLRGHGDSTQRVSLDGYREEIDAAKLNKNLMADMVQFDMKAVRRFLVTKNDSGQLNLNKLCLVGAGMGASVAASWAAVDWAWPPLAVGKQGQDVKALVLISPRWKFQGLLMQDALGIEDFKVGASWLLICGTQETRVKTDATRIYKQLEKFHPPSESTRPERPSGLQAIGWESSLQGSKLLSQVGAPLEDPIIEFLAANVAQEDYPWIERRSRLE